MCSCISDESNRHRVVLKELVAAIQLRKLFCCGVLAVVGSSAPCAQGDGDGGEVVVDRAYSPLLTTPAVRVVADPENPRTEALMQLLLTRFATVSLSGETLPYQESENVVLVVDHGSSHLLKQFDTGPPYQDRDGRVSLPATVFIGDSCRFGARRFGLVHASEDFVQPISPTGSWHRETPLQYSSLVSEKLVENENGVKVAVCGDLMGGVNPPVLEGVLVSPRIGVIVSGQDSMGKKLALVWHQGRYVFFSPGGAANAYDDEWREVFLESVSLAGAFPRFVHGYGQPVVRQLEVGKVLNYRPHLQEESLLNPGITEPSVVKTLIARLGSLEVEDRFSARQELEFTMNIGWRRSYSELPYPGASATDWQEFWRKWGPFAFRSGSDGRWYIDEEAADLNCSPSQLDSVRRASRGYEAFSGGEVELWNVEWFDNALIASSEKSERQAVMGAIFSDAHIVNKAGDLLAGALARSSGEGRELVPYYALAIAACGPSEFDSLWRLAQEPRPFFVWREGSSEGSRATIGQGTVVLGELSVAFDRMSWNINSRENYFSNCVGLLEGVVRELLAYEDSQFGRMPTRVEQCRALAFELIAAISVGQIRGLVRIEKLALIEDMARDCVSSDSEILKDEVLISELLGLLRGFDNAVGIELASARRRFSSKEKGWRENYNRFGLQVHDFGSLGIAESLRKEISSDSGSTSLAARLSSNPTFPRDSESLGDSQLLTLRYSALVSDGVILAGLLDDSIADSRLDSPNNLWLRRQAAFSLCSPYVDVRPARKALMRLVGGSGDGWVRSFACHALRDASGCADSVELALLDQLARGADYELAILAKNALRGQLDPLGWRLEALVDNAGFAGERKALDLLDGGGWKLLDSIDPIVRSETANEMAIQLGAELLAELSNDNELAMERIARLESEVLLGTLRSIRGLDLASRLQSQRELFSGSYALWASPEIERELMHPWCQQSRAYQLSTIYTTWGSDAWPIYLSSLYHWRGFGFGFVVPFERAFGDVSGIVAPFFAMHYANSVVRRNDEGALHVTEEGVPSDGFVALWRSLGEAGVDALKELSSYPDPLVRRAVNALSSRL